MKYKWKVGEEPTGRYRSFETRMWPGAYYLDGKESAAAMLFCDDNPDYEPWRIKEGNHGEITIMVADHSIEPWKWRKVKKTAKTLQEAKDMVKRIIHTNPHLVPKGV